MNALTQSILATFVVSLIAFVGIFSLALTAKSLKKVLLLMVGFSAGALLGGALLHLIPEAVESISSGMVFSSVLLGFSVFFITERFLFWRHCHEGKCPIHTFTYMNLLGDSIHNFIDGMVIAASFVVSSSFGVITTIAIIAHEIPQELGDFGVLVYGGFSRVKALMFNFFTALTAVLGALVGYFAASQIEQFIPLLVAFAAGGFIYISASDLVPELHKETDLRKSVSSFIFFMVGILFMYSLKAFFGE